MATTPAPITRWATPPVPGGEPEYQTRPLPSSGSILESSQSAIPRSVMSESVELVRELFQYAAVQIRDQVRHFGFLKFRPLDFLLLHDPQHFRSVTPRRRGQSNG